MNSPARVVFDCNVFLQALANPSGPAGRCVDLALSGTVALFVSQKALDEINDVTSRPELIAKFRLRAERVEILLQSLTTAAVLMTNVPAKWQYDRDPDDAHYVDLAVAGGADFLVTRDRDLLDLMDQSRTGGRDFHKAFPGLRVLDPVAFLRVVASSGSGS